MDVAKQLKLLKRIIKTKYELEDDLHELVIAIGNNPKKNHKNYIKMKEILLDIEDLDFESLRI